MKHLRKIFESLFERIPITDEDPIEDMEGEVRFEPVSRSEFQKICNFLKPDVRGHLGPFASDYYHWAPDVEIVTFSEHMEDEDGVGGDDRDEWRIYKTDDYYYLVHVLEWRMDDIENEFFYKCDTMDGLFALLRSKKMGRFGT